MSKMHVKIANAVRLGALSLWTSLSLTTVHGTAADISCMKTWASSAVAEVRFEDFPSGRRPTERTCFAILIQGPIQSGDAQKFIEILRQNHPFVEIVNVHHRADPWRTQLKSVAR